MAKPLRCDACPEWQVEVDNGIVPIVGKCRKYSRVTAAGNFCSTITEEVERDSK